jgi:hypothetical protein
VFRGLSVIQFFIFPDQTGTATSSPIELTTSQSELNIPSTMIWMQRNAYEESTNVSVRERMMDLTEAVVWLLITGQALVGLAILLATKFFNKRAQRRYM